MSSIWRDFPDPRERGVLVAPLGPGIYELRMKSDRSGLLVGHGKNCASRMSSLFPAPWGCGTRNNRDKRLFVEAHTAEIEYRTIACRSVEEAKQIEREMLRTGKYRFKT